VDQRRVASWRVTISSTPSRSNHCAYSSNRPSTDHSRHVDHGGRHAPIESTDACFARSSWWRDAVGQRIWVRTRVGPRPEARLLHWTGSRRRSRRRCSRRGETPVRSSTSMHDVEALSSYRPRHCEVRSTLRGIMWRSAERLRAASRRSPSTAVAVASPPAPCRAHQRPLRTPSDETAFMAPCTAATGDRPGSSPGARERSPIADSLGDAEELDHEPIVANSTSTERTPRCLTRDGSPTSRFRRRATKESGPWRRPSCPRLSTRIGPR